MKPTTLILLFAATALAAPKGTASPAGPSSTSTSSPGLLSTLNAAACKRVIAGNANTVAQIAKLKAAGVAVPPYLSGYLIAAKAAESELGCSGAPASASVSAVAST